MWKEWIQFINIYLLWADICVPPKCVYWNPNPQGDHFRRGMPLGGDEVIRVEPSWMWLVPVEKRHRELSHPFWNVRVQRKAAGCETGNSSSADNKTARASIFDFSASRTVRYFQFNKPPSLWYVCYVSPNGLRYIHIIEYSTVVKINAK